MSKCWAWGSTEPPAPAASTTTGELVLSGNGHTLALVGRDTVHHFSFVIDGEDPVVRGESVDCFDLPVRQSQGFSTD